MYHTCWTTSTTVPNSRVGLLSSSLHVSSVFKNIPHKAEWLAYPRSQTSRLGQHRYAFPHNTVQGVVWEAVEPLVGIWQIVFEFLWIIVYAVITFCLCPQTYGGPCRGSANVIKLHTHTFDQTELLAKVCYRFVPFPITVTSQTVLLENIIMYAKSRRYFMEDLEMDLESRSWITLHLAVRPINAPFILPCHNAVSGGLENMPRLWTQQRWGSSGQDWAIP